MLPDFSYEDNLWLENEILIGIDEVGRGAFAGPVTAAGVVFPKDMSISKRNYLLTLGINDSKKLSPKKREILSEIIKEEALFYDICFISVETINKIGIGKATFEGMRKAVESIVTSAARTCKDDLSLFALVDGFTVPELNISQKAIVRGDSISLSIAAASIIAKVERDKLMVELGNVHPQFFWGKNKGYGTLEHRQAIARLGLNIHHRVDFCG